MLVAGSAIFSPGKTEQNAREFLKLARAARGRIRDDESCPVSDGPGRAADEIQGSLHFAALRSR